MKGYQQRRRTAAPLTNPSPNTLAILLSTVTPPSVRCRDQRRPPFQVSRQQAMKQLLSGLAAYGKSPSTVSARFQSTLHILTNAQIFLLHPIAHVNRLLVVLPTSFADIAEIEVKNNFAMVRIYRNN